MCAMARLGFACCSAIPMAMKRSCSRCIGLGNRGGSWFGGGRGGLVMGRGSFVGSRSGMLELLFDNQDALIRSKQVYMRLGTRDDVDGGVEEGEEEQEEEEGEKEEGENKKVEDTNAPTEVKNE